MEYPFFILRALAGRTSRADADETNNLLWPGIIDIMKAGLRGRLGMRAKLSFKRETPGRPGVAIGAIALVLLTTGFAQADQIERPKFRTGLWRFERTVEYVRRPPNVNLVLTKSDTIRCVDPNVAMIGIFASPNVGNCRSEKPQLFDKQYVFPNRCDFMGPVSTVITAESDVSYTEVNVLPIDPLPKRDMVIAHRVGDCTTPNSQAFAEGSSVNSRRNR